MRWTPPFRRLALLAAAPQPEGLGLPLSAWLLIALAGGAGLGVELWFYLRHSTRLRRHRRGEAGSDR